jgi:NAD(P)-dependent dehydrogenase (short-subunit alcohol dehydrogenase family)
MEEFARLFDLSGRRTLAIGAGSGIGAASATGLAAFRAEVWCADINGEAIAKVAAWTAP